MPSRNRTVLLSFCWRHRPSDGASVARRWAQRRSGGPRRGLDGTPKVEEQFDEAAWQPTDRSGQRFKGSTAKTHGRAILLTWLFVMSEANTRKIIHVDMDAFYA